MRSVTSVLRTSNARVKLSRTNSLIIEPQKTEGEKIKFVMSDLARIEFVKAIRYLSVESYSYLQELVILKRKTTDKGRYLFKKKNEDDYWLEAANKNDLVKSIKN